MALPFLDITARTTLGRRLQLSAAYFESGAAELIGAEADKLDALIAAYSANTTLGNLSSVTAANRSIKGVITALSNLEGAILRKISIATALHK